MKRVLIGEVSSYKAIVLCEFLIKNYNEIELYTFDYRNYTKRIRTKYSKKHFIIEENNLDHLTELINNNAINVFFPVSSDLIGVCIKNKELFGRTIDYLGDFETFNKLNDKDLLMKLAQYIGVLTPKTFNCLNEVTFPCVLKPTISASSIGVEYLYNSDDLDKVLSTNLDGNYIIQEFVKGEGVGYSVYAKNGVIVKGFGHLRLGEYPISGGSSVYRKEYENKEMRFCAEAILKETKWTGFAMFEFKLSKDDKVYLIEVNPRLWGSLNQGLQNGVNYFESILGETNNELKLKNRYTYIPPLIYLSILKYIFKLKFKTLITFLSNLNKNKSDISLFNDFFGYMSTIIRKIL